MHARTLFTLATVLGTAACSQGTRFVRTERTPIAAMEENRIAGSYAPRGTRVPMTLDETIDTATATPGQRFTARLAAPIMANDGSVIAPTGARVTGSIVSTMEGRSPLLDLAIMTVNDSRAMAQPIQARVRRVHVEMYRGERRAAQPPADYSFGEAFYGPRVPGSQLDVSAQGPQNGGGGSGGYYGRVREARLPAGDTLQLELTAPMLGANASFTAR